MGIITLLVVIMPTDTKLKFFLDLPINKEEDNDGRQKLYCKNYYHDYKLYSDEADARREKEMIRHIDENSNLEQARFFK